MLRTLQITTAIFALASPSFAERAIDPYDHTEFDSGFPVGPIDADIRAWNLSLPKAGVLDTSGGAGKQIKSNDKIQRIRPEK